MIVRADNRVFKVPGDFGACPPVARQAAGAVLDYELDWSGWFPANWIETSAWSAHPAGCEFSRESYTYDTTRVFITAPAPGDYLITNRAEAALYKLADERSFRLEVR